MDASPMSTPRVASMAHLQQDSKARHPMEEHSLKLADAQPQQPGRRPHKQPR